MSNENANQKDIQDCFGVLQGLKVATFGEDIAGAVIGSIFAEQGATVIHVERGRDPLRNADNLWSMEHRNQQSVAIDTETEEGRELLRQLAVGADVLVESLKPADWDALSLSDESLWNSNPSLVVAHVTGFGRWGDPDYVNREFTDPMIQAMSGFMLVNGMEGGQPLAGKPTLAAYATALMSSWAILAAVHHARKTGEGDSLDIAQFEVMARLSGNYLTDGIDKGLQVTRMGNLNAVGVGRGTERCKDGKWAYIPLGGAGPLSKLERLIGLEGHPLFAEPHSIMPRSKPEMGAVFNDALAAFCSEHTAAEIDAILGAQSIPCSQIMTHETMRENSHYQARGDILEWTDETTGETVCGFGVVPKFSRNPSQVTHGGPAYGADNVSILQGLGYSAEEIIQLGEKGVLLG